MCLFQGLPGPQGPTGFPGPKGPPVSPDSDKHTTLYTNPTITIPAPFKNIKPPKSLRHILLSCPCIIPNVPNDVQRVVKVDAASRVVAWESRGRWGRKPASEAKHNVNKALEKTTQPVNISVCSGGRSTRKTAPVVSIERRFTLFV